MNKENLLKLANYLDTIEQDKFNMKFFMVGHLIVHESAFKNL